MTVTVFSGGLLLEEFVLLLKRPEIFENGQKDSSDLVVDVGHMEWCYLNYTSKVGAFQPKSPQQKTLNHNPLEGNRGVLFRGPCARACFQRHTLN